MQIADNEKPGPSFQQFHGSGSAPSSASSISSWIDTPGSDSLPDAARAIRWPTRWLTADQRQLFSIISTCSATVDPANYSVTGESHYAEMGARRQGANAAKSTAPPPTGSWSGKPPVDARLAQTSNWSPNRG